jgi:hypothetical protein
MVNVLFRAGILHAPLPIPETDFPIVQYADDTLLIMQACPQQLLALKQLLHDFSRATGLRVNYSKSSMMAINIDEQNLAHLANVFGCATGSLPFTYLGLPLGTTRPSVQDLSPIVDQVERRLNASARFLGYGGRLELINSVISSLPNHFISSLKVHKTIIKIFDRSRRHCLWAKRDEDTSSSHSLAAWTAVCRPKNHGGLGIKNIELQNKALLLKQLHKFYCKENTPWVNLVWRQYGHGAPHAQSSRGSFWWRDIFSLVDIYRSITISQIGNGESTLFWKDFWTNGATLCNQFPRLFSFARSEDTAVAEFALTTDLTTLFTLPFSMEAHAEYEQVQHLIADTNITGDLDTRRFIWGSTSYTSSRFYQYIFSAVPCDRALRAIWKSRCLPKLKVFVWLLFKDRLNTRDMMLRRQWHFISGPTCVLCQDQVLETRDHLFFECTFAKNCWNTCHIIWDMDLAIEARYATARLIFAGPCFMEIVACVAWNVWKERNDHIFRGILPSFQRWRVRVQSDLMLHQFRVKTALVQPLVDWVASIFI